MNVRWTAVSLVMLALGAVGMANAAPLVLTTADTPPFSGDGGDAYYDNVLRATFDRLGVELDIRHNVPSERSLRDANAGITDGTFGRIAGLEAAFPHLTIVPFPLATCSFVSFTRSGAIRIDSFEDLGNLDVAYIQGWKAYEQRVQSARAVVRVGTEEQLFKMLFDGRVDAILYNSACGRAYLDRTGAPNRAMEGPILLVSDMHLYLHERHAALVPRILATLESMAADGELDALSRRYLGRTYR